MLQAKYVVFADHVKLVNIMRTLAINKYTDIRDSSQLHRCQKCNRRGALRYLA